MFFLKRLLINPLTDLLFPHCCEGCGKMMDQRDGFICARCAYELPNTHFAFQPGNPVEKMFFGRLPVVRAMAQYFYGKGSAIAHLIHRIKYDGKKELAIQLGHVLGHELKDAWLPLPDMIIPMPLHRAREKRRGYNQAAMIGKGIADVLGIPMRTDLIVREMQTGTQTKKGRVERWKNMEGRFRVRDPGLEGTHFLLVDDVITTGASLEACGTELLKINGSSLSISCIGYSYR